MQGDPGPSRSLDKKRKSVESSSSSSSSSVNTAVRKKKARKSGSPSSTCETGKIETQWPDHFKEVSVHESNLDLTPGTLYPSVVQGVFIIVTRVASLDSLSLVYRYSRSAAYPNTLTQSSTPLPGIEHGASFLHVEKTVRYLL